jgi:hypothetical protein
VLSHKLDLNLTVTRNAAEMGPKSLSSLSQPTVGTAHATGEDRLVMHRTSCISDNYHLSFGHSGQRVQVLHHSPCPQHFPNRWSCCSALFWATYIPRKPNPRANLRLQLCHSEILLLHGQGPPSTLSLPCRTLCTQDSSTFLSQAPSGRGSTSQQRCQEVPICAYPLSPQHTPCACTFPPCGPHLLILPRLTLPVFPCVHS